MVLFLEALFLRLFFVATGAWRHRYGLSYAPSHARSCAFFLLFPIICLVLFLSMVFAALSEDLSVAMRASRRRYPL